MPVILTLRRIKQEDGKFEASLGSKQNKTKEGHSFKMITFTPIPHIKTKTMVACKNKESQELSFI
jgi:hypothetical protein